MAQTKTELQLGEVKEIHIHIILRSLVLLVLLLEYFCMGDVEWCLHATSAKTTCTPTRACMDTDLAGRRAVARSEKKKSVRTGLLAAE